MTCRSCGVRRSTPPPPRVTSLPRTEPCSSVPPRRGRGREVLSGERTRCPVATRVGPSGDGGIRRRGVGPTMTADRGAGRRRAVLLTVGLLVVAAAVGVPAAWRLLRPATEPLPLTVVTKVSLPGAASRFD